MLNLCLLAIQKHSILSVLCSLFPTPLSTVLYLTPYAGIKLGSISHVLYSFLDPLASVEFCMPLRILSFIALQEQGQTQHQMICFSFLCITL